MREEWLLLVIASNGSLFIMKHADVNSSHCKTSVTASVFDVKLLDYAECLHGVGNLPFSPCLVGPGSPNSASGTEWMAAPTVIVSSMTAQHLMQGRLR